MRGPHTNLKMCEECVELAAQSASKSLRHSSLGISSSSFALRSTNGWLRRSLPFKWRRLKAQNTSLCGPLKRLKVRDATLILNITSPSMIADRQPSLAAALVNPLTRGNARSNRRRCGYRQVLYAARWWGRSYSRHAWLRGSTQHTEEGDQLRLRVAAW